MVCMLYMYCMHFSDTIMATHSPRAALIGFVGALTSPPPVLRLPTAHGHIPKVFNIVGGEYDIIRGI